MTTTSSVAYVLNLLEQEVGYGEPGIMGMMESVGFGVRVLE